MTALNMELVLASTSQHRKKLMERIGLPFRVVRPNCDENEAKKGCATPHAIALHLSVIKAQSVRSLEPSATLIGSDQVVAIGSESFGKPGTPENAAKQLELLSGRTHEVLTGLAVIHGMETFTHVEVARMAMRKLSRVQIERYIERDLPLDCAGSYRLESSGIVLFDNISVRDHSSISGLPLLELTRILSHLGFQVP